jgi:hypothetical protein
VKTLNCIPGSAACIQSVYYSLKKSNISEVLSYLVETGRRHTSAQLRRSTALNLKVDTLRVGLSTVGLSGGVQSNDLMADDVVSWCDVGDSEVPLLHLR